MKRRAPCLRRSPKERTSGLGVRDLDVRLPDGRPLLTNLDLDLASGESLLVKGPSWQWQDQPCYVAWPACGRT
jgi:ABC-type uncharacterized transport system fused permease/ATPase subunit